MSKYAAQDFANAKFAEHPDGGAGSHRRHDGWVLGSEARHSDADMARAGWVPVPTKPQITESQYKLALDEDRDPQYVYGFTNAMRLFGGEVTPDPEPTNTERLEQLVRESGFKVSDFLGYATYDSFAKYLNDHGVTASEDNA